MESVNARQADERVRQIRDEYRKRENDLKLKQSNELKRLSQRYADDLHKLQKQSEEHLQDFRSKSRASLSKKDNDYQNQIHQIQVQNRRHLENQLGELKAKHKNQFNALTTQVRKEKQMQELQEQRLKKTFTQEIEKKDKLHQEIISENARKARQSLEQRVGDINKRHEESQRNLALDRDQKLAEKARQAQQQKQISNKELRDLERSLSNQLRHERRSSQTNLMSEREAHRNINEMQREAFQEGIENVRNRFQKAYAKDKLEAQEARYAFEDSVNDRLEGRVGNLESRLILMKKVHDGEKLKMKSDLDRDRKSMAANYREQLKGFEESRRELITEFNRNTHNEINDVIHEKDLHFKQQMRRMRDDTTTREMINRQALEDLRTFHEERQLHVETQADQRVEAMTNELNQKLKTMEGAFQDRLETQKDDYQEALHEIRLHNQAERAKLVRRFQNHSKEREKFYDNKLKGVKLHHKAEMTHMKRDQDRNMRSLAESKDRRFNTQRRAYEKQMDATKVYYESKVEENNIAHEEEINRLKSKHEEQIRKMIVTIQHNQRDHARG